MKEPLVCNDRRFNRLLDFLGYTLERIDRRWLKHRYQRVCALAFNLLNTYGYG